MLSHNQAWIKLVEWFLSVSHGCWFIVCWKTIPAVFSTREVRLFERMVPPSPIKKKQTKNRCYGSIRCGAHSLESSVVLASTSSACIEFQLSIMVVSFIELNEWKKITAAANGSSNSSVMYRSGRGDVLMTTAQSHFVILVRHPDENPDVKLMFVLLEGIELDPVLLLILGSFLL